MCQFCNFPGPVTTRLTATADLSIRQICLYNYLSINLSLYIYIYKYIILSIYLFSLKPILTSRLPNCAKRLIIINVYYLHFNNKIYVANNHFSRKRGAKRDVTYVLCINTVLNIHSAAKTYSSASNHHHFPLIDVKRVNARIMLCFPALFSSLLVNNCNGAPCPPPQKKKLASISY